MKTKIGEPSRVLYIRIDGKIYVLHSFPEKTNKTPPKEIDTANRRLKTVRLKIEIAKREKKHGDRRQS